MTLIVSACRIKPGAINKLAYRAQRDGILERYDRIPREEILQRDFGRRLYGDLMDRYKRTLVAMKGDADADGAKLVVVVLTPEVGHASTLSNTYGIPFITKNCEDMGIDWYDLSPVFAVTDIAELSVLPDEGGWTKTGAALVASQLADIIKKYDSVSSSRKPSTAAKPETFGDLEPGEDEVVDRDKNLPYHLKVNNQGLRMNKDLTFPKAKQTILILGDGQVYNPYLDNDFIATTLLQQQFPDKVIINAAAPDYTLEDYESLYEEKARYTEPDIVIVCTNGDDILDFYFSQRNHYSRAAKIYPGTDVEKNFYRQLYKQ